MKSIITTVNERQEEQRTEFLANNEQHNNNDNRKLSPFVHLLELITKILQLNQPSRQNYSDIASHYKQRTTKVSETIPDKQTSSRQNADITTRTKLSLLINK